MGLLDSVLADDARFAFVNADEFAEEGTYTKPGSATRTINAIVERMSPQPGRSETGALLPFMRIHVQNNATRGITSSEWRNGDTFTIAERKGGTPRTFQIHWPSDQQQHDAGMVTFELR